MGRRHCDFTQRDVTRAVRAVTAAGKPIARVEIDQTGKIVLVVANDLDRVEPVNEWDTV